MKAVYIVKPKNIFRHPFNKFDLDKPMNRDSQNDDITDFFNYGFNEDTMIIYGKLVKRTIEVLDEGINPTYFDSPSELMRLNDQIPMDFGGFCKFFDTSIFESPDGNTDEYMINYHNGERLFNFFIYIASPKNQIVSSQYPLIDFVKCMYKNSVSDELEMCDVMETIEQNLQRKYQQTMKKLVQKKNNPGGTTSGPGNPPNNRNNQNLKDKKTSNEQQGGEFMKQIGKNIKRQQQDPSKMQSSSDSDSQSGSDDSSRSSQSESENQKRKNKNRKRSGRSRSQSRNRKDKNKHKKIHKQQKERKNKDRKDRHKQRSDKKKKRSKQRERERERSRQRRKDKNKKRKN